MFVLIFNDDPELVAYGTWALRVYGAGLFAIGMQHACQQSFVALGQAKISLFLALLRKFILLIPLIFILPHFFANQVFAVFLAEPVADILAATTTGTLFFWPLVQDSGCAGTSPDHTKQRPVSPPVRHAAGLRKETTAEWSFCQRPFSAFSPSPYWAIFSCPGG